MADPNTINLLRIELPINSAVYRGPAYEFGIAGRGAYDYSWIFYTSCVLAFIMAAGSGSNDVANSFATSVGARSLKMWQVVIAASICEFAGAFLLGSRTVDTVRSNIVTPQLYTNHEDLLMFGMFCALLWVGFWLFLASYYEINVSTTHSIIGSIIGFGLCTPAGGGAINWPEVGKIVGSWFASPVLTALLAAGIFLFVRHFILRRENSHERALVFFPFIAFITFFVNLFFVMYNGGITQGRGLSTVRLTVGETVGWAVLGAFIVFLLVALIFNPCLRRRLANLTDEQLAQSMGFKDYYGTKTVTDPANASVHDLKQATEFATEHAIMDGKVDGKVGGEEDVEIANGDASASAEPTTTSPTETSSVRDDTSSMRELPWWEKKLDWAFRQDSIHGSVDTLDKISEIHNKAEKFSIRAEYTFGYLQVMTACFASFAHGAGDVANYIGPLAAINEVYKNGAGSTKSRSGVDDWLLILGGCGLVFGLATYGQKVIAAFGVKTVRVTPARGFSIELAAAVIIIVAAFLGIPISTSHSFVGAIVGIGLCEGRKEAVNWHIVMKNMAWWLATLIVCGLVTAALFSFGTFSPSQIYPLSKSNCMAFYGTIQNFTNGDPTTFVIEARDGTLIGLYGYPSTGQVFSL